MGLPQTLLNEKNLEEIVRGFMVSRQNFKELELLLKLNYPIEEKHTLVDIGAQVGGFAKPFAKKGWRIVAFEPEPENYNHLTANLKEYEDATCIPKAVADRAQKKAPFYISKEHWGIHGLKPFHPTHSDVLMVETVRLDETLSSIGVDTVTLLKIDTEGADFLALKSFDFATHQPLVVMCEFMDDRSEKYYQYTHHDMAAFMIDLGYAAFVSEWAPIVEYGRKGIPSAPHTFLHCGPYPLNHDPAWGNLIFVPRAQGTQFESTLSAYMEELGRFSWAEGLRSFFRVVPGARPLYHFLRRVRQTRSGSQ